MEGGDNSLMGKKERIRKKETICSNTTTALYLFPAAQVDAAGSIKKSKQDALTPVSVCRAFVLDAMNADVGVTVSLASMIQPRDRYPCALFSISCTLHPTASVYEGAL